jgi:hypothetical protein
MVRHIRFQARFGFVAGSLAILVVGAVSNSAKAFPSSGANCAMCHTDSGGGEVTISPSPLSLLAGESGTVTFDVSNLPGDGAALSLTGLDAAGLVATPDADWQARDNNTRYTLSFAAAGPQTFDLVIGDNATPGDYPIGVFLAGGGSTPAGIWSTMSQFTVSVSAIPEPSTAILLSILLGVAATGVVRHRRRQSLGDH